MKSKNEYVKFTKKVCENCKNKNIDEDICRINRNINGKLQCINYKAKMK